MKVKERALSHCKRVPFPCEDEVCRAVSGAVRAVAYIHKRDSNNMQVLCRVCPTTSQANASTELSVGRHHVPCSIHERDRERERDVYFAIQKKGSFRLLFGWNVTGVYS
jgi:hypothetical protein